MVKKVAWLGTPNQRAFSAQHNYATVELVYDIDSWIILTFFVLTVRLFEKDQKGGNLSDLK